MSCETDLIVSRYVSDWFSLSLFQRENFENEFAQVYIRFSELIQIRCDSVVDSDFTVSNETFLSVSSILVR